MSGADIVAYVENHIAKRRGLTEHEARDRAAEMPGDAVPYWCWSCRAWHVETVAKLTKYAERGGRTPQHGLLAVPTEAEAAWRAGKAVGVHKEIWAAWECPECGFWHLTPEWATS